MEQASGKYECRLCQSTDLKVEFEKTILNKYKGGFKFEAQRALKIDGTPLKVF